MSENDMLAALAPARGSDQPRGIFSVCSAHPLVLRAALRHAKQNNQSVLIEATCNQVNHVGGYTGMTPCDFADLVSNLATEEGLPSNMIILGGDHLGPNPWRDLPAEQAMVEAEAMVEAYVRAGFHKIHLDASMGCAGEPLALDDNITAGRAARLARVAEASARDVGGKMPVYIIGTEVPPPGGADHALDSVSPTDSAAAHTTIDIHRRVFAEMGLSDAFARVLGLVVQPGVEFGNQNVITYARDAAQSLVHVLDDYPELVFEAHSTDYQGQQPLTELVEDGFAILKVGPELTFVLREALYALDLIASDLLPEYGDRPLYRALEQTMLAAPDNWARHYEGSADKQFLLRHYSLSDRIRYYWPTETAQRAVDTLLQALAGKVLPLPLLWQHFPGASQFAGRACDPEGLLIWRVTQSLNTYQAACLSPTPLARKLAADA